MVEQWCSVVLLGGLTLLVAGGVAGNRPGLVVTDVLLLGTAAGPLGRPMLRISPVLHGFMAYMVFAWGLLCVLTGALIAVYAIIS